MNERDRGGATVVAGPFDAGRARRVAGRRFTAANFLVGVWLVLSPLLFAGSVLDGEDDVVVGTVLLGLAAFGAYRLTRRATPPKAALVAGAVAGLWLVAFAADYGDGVLMYDGLVTGLALTVSNGYLYRRYLR